MSLNDAVLYRRIASLAAAKLCDRGIYARIAARNQHTWKLCWGKSAPPLIEFYPPFGYLLNEISSRIFFFHRQFRVFVAGEVEGTRAPWWPINILPRSETIAYRSLNRRKLCQEWIVYVRNLYGSDFRDFCSFSFFFLRIESNF